MYSFSVAALFPARWSGGCAGVDSAALARAGVLVYFLLQKQVDADEIPIG